MLLEVSWLFSGLPHSWSLRAVVVLNSPEISSHGGLHTWTLLLLYFWLCMKQSLEIHWINLHPKMLSILPSISITLIGFFARKKSSGFCFFTFCRFSDLLPFKRGEPFKTHWQWQIWQHTDVKTSLWKVMPSGCLSSFSAVLFYMFCTNGLSTTSSGLGMVIVGAGLFHSQVLWKHDIRSPKLLHCECGDLRRFRKCPSDEAFRPGKKPVVPKLAGDTWMDYVCLGGCWWDHNWSFNFNKVNSEVEMVTVNVSDRVVDVRMSLET